MKSRENSKTKTQIHNKPVLIVAIGASAGGIEAVTDLLKHLVSDTGMAFVYIQHLDPTHESMLSTILAKATKMKVVEAKDLLPIEPDHLYVIPPNKDMALVDGVLTLNTRKARPSMHMPVDQFFISLAENHKETAIGIILSGNASDGTVGLKAIKIAGGITFAQDDTAKFHSMPKSAIAEGVVDLVLSPDKIAKELERISKQTDTLKLAISPPSEEKETEPIDESAEEDLRNIIQLLKKSTSVDFTHYKVATIRRRIVRRMVLYRLDTLNDYTQYLRQHTNEIGLLYQDLLINVTSFFRDEDAMEYFKTTLLPDILKNKGDNDPLRIWIPACSTGEEAYSVAILIVELLAERASEKAIQIFATDLSELAISKARLGVYTRNDLADVSPKRLQRFFTKIDGSYRIIKSIRDLCVFAPHNIFKDPPFSRLDFISCCNLLIYLDTVLQRKIIATFHYALNNNGYLMLGKSETIGTAGQLFIQVEKNYKIYAKRKDASAMAMFEMSTRVQAIERKVSTTNKIVEKNKSNATDLEKLIDNILLADYTPACVVINQDLEILQFRGSTSLYLEPSSGKASLNLMKMTRPGLGFELRNAIHKASKTGERVKKPGLQVKNKSQTYPVAIEVVPIKIDDDEKNFLILFEESTELSTADTKTVLTKDKYIKQLQDELSAAREDMRAIIEDQEASNEELQSANEEIVSSNEELQSINEELETSKEEVESTNEELMTINTELQMRNDQLAESYEYSEAVFNTIREAVIVLDQNLRIKVANNSFYKLFRLTEEETEEKLIYELGDGQWNIPRLKEFLEDVIPNHIEFHGFELNHSFPLTGQKALLLNGKRVVQKVHLRQLILVAIEDVTEHKEAERLIQEREAWFHNMADNAPVMIWVADTAKHRTFFNKTWLDFTGKTMGEETQNGWTSNVHKDDIDNLLKVYNSSFDERKPFQVEYRLRRHDGEYFWMMSTARPTFSLNEEFTGYVGTVTNIHDKKVHAEELDKRVQERTKDLREMNKELERSNSELQQFAYVASHDLQEPLRKIMTFSDRLQGFKESISAQAKSYIEKIGSSSERMSKLIEDLLNFSSISRNNKNFIRTDLSTIVKNVLADFDLIIMQKKAQINFDGLPVIDAIPVQMEQLFHNLLSNSLKFSKDDTPPEITITARDISREEIPVRLKSLETSDGYVEIKLSDNGIGFNEEFADQIFVIFQRLNDQKSFPGTGIGLALCRKIVNNHGGEIYAESKQNEGSAFRIILPKKLSSTIQT